MAIVTQAFTRSGNRPDLATLTETLRPLLAVANVGSFYIGYQNGQVLVEQGSFAGVDLTACQNAVTAAVDETERTLTKAAIDTLPLFQKALFLVLLDEVNRLRTQPTTAFAAVTPAQAWAAVKAKADTL